MSSHDGGKKTIKGAAKSWPMASNPSNCGVNKGLDVKNPVPSRATLMQVSGPSARSNKIPPTGLSARLKTSKLVQGTKFKQIKVRSPMYRSDLAQSQPSSLMSLNKPEISGDIVSNQAGLVSKTEHGSPMPSLPLIEGHKIILESAIGSGGYSTVFRGHDHSIDCSVAVKITRKSPGVVNLLKEIDLLKSLKGVSEIVDLIAHQVTQDCIYIVMELGSMDLKSVIKQRNQTNSPLNCDFVKYWGSQMLKCVRAIHHRNIVHADIKPANFLIVNGGLKLIDFGISDQLPDYTCGVHRLDQVGTLAYMAPETLIATSHQTPAQTSENLDLGDQLTAKPVKDYRVSKASDLWSCGCILYEMVYGRVPFRASTSLEFIKLISNADTEVSHAKLATGDVPVPFGLHEVLRGCLQRSASKRFTANEALDTLFFSSICVDIEFLRAVMVESVEYGKRMSDRSMSHDDSSKFDDKIKAAWNHVAKLNKGG